MDRKPDGNIAPHLSVNGGKAACEFYEKAFGAKTLAQMPEENGDRLMHASLEINGALVMLHDHFPEFHNAGHVEPPASGIPSTVTIHIAVDDTDTWWDRAVDAGAEIVFPLENQFWGERYGKLRDPFGHIWSIGGPKK